jgi:hypothetical protein
MSVRALVFAPLTGILSAGLVLQSTCSSGDDDGLPQELEHDALFYVDNPLLVPIEADPAIDPNSSLYVERMTSVAQNNGFVMVLNEYAAPIYYADASTPRYDVLLDLYGLSSYCGKQYLLNVPIPDWAEADPGSDKHMVVVDRENGCVFDFWGYNNNLGVPQPNAWWASAIDTESDGIYHTTVGAGNAANLSFANAAVWPDEMEAGEINHALVFGYDASSIRLGDPVAPAEHNDGSSEADYAIPEAAHIQLDPTLDLETLGLEPYEKVIARALQVYGMYLVDGSGGPIAIHAVSGQSAATNPWDGVVPNADANSISLRNIPAEHFRVLQMPEPHAGVSGCADTRCGVYQ